jgi:DNA repair protein RadA/Sms
MRVDDPACDLAVAAALASSATGRPPPEGAGFVGEVALTGQVRTAPAMAQRLSAARAAGIRTVFAAPGSPSAAQGVRIVAVGHVRDALGWAGASGGRGSLEEVVSAG